MTVTNRSTSHLNIPKNHIVLDTSHIINPLNNWDIINKEKLSPISKSRLEELEFLEKNLDIIIRYEVYKSVKAENDRIEKK